MSTAKESEGLTILINENIDPKVAVEIEQKTFRDEPTETIEGIEFLLKHGKVIVVQGKIDGKDVQGIAESIELGKLIERIALRGFPNRITKESPLRMILENDKEEKYLLRRVMFDYPHHRSHYYVHELAMSPQRADVANALYKALLKGVNGERALFFGFVQASQLNLHYLRLFLSYGAIIDNVEYEVYRPDTAYFRMVLNADGKFKVNPRDVKVVPLRGDHLKQIGILLATGYVGTAYKQDSLVFARKT